MATIDTTESSANQYRSKNQQRRGGPRLRRDYPSFSERSSGNPGNRSQDAEFKEERFFHPRESRPSRFQDAHPKDVPSQETRSRDAQILRDQPQDTKLQEKRNQDAYRIKNSYRKEEHADSNAPYNSQNNNFGGKRGGARGGVANRMQVREHKIRGFVHGEVERDQQPSNSEHSNSEVVPNLREFTNSTYKNTTVQEGGKSMQVDVTGPTGVRGTQTSQDVVISNKENVQTISVTITNTTTERKSYAKERRGKGGSRTGLGQVAVEEVDSTGDSKAVSVAENSEAVQSVSTQGNYLLLKQQISANV